MSSPPEIRVLVIDDSAYNRQTITTMLSSVAGIRVVARAADGDEGLRRVFEHAPDIITLDLEMPRMDGFTFLRILMQRKPTPVIVVSSYARKENVFKALELGALDFIAKPAHGVSGELTGIEAELAGKVRLVTRLRVVALAERARAPSPVAPPPPIVISPAGPTLRLVVLGAYTGGPPAVQRTLSALDARSGVCVLVAQHMPPAFTATFAERLDRQSSFEVREARDGDALRPGLALIAPGGSHLEVDCPPGGLPRARVLPAGTADRWVPSLDRLLASVAGVAGRRAMAVVLTGMGDDGAEGVRSIKLAGGRVVVESADTAVMTGMPEAALATGLVDEVVPLHGMPGVITRFAAEER